MSADTTLVIARVGDKFVPAVVQAVENLFEGTKEECWDTAQLFLEPSRQTFDSPAAAIEYEIDRDRKEEVFIEYPTPCHVVLDLERNEVRQLAS